jgi:hypothetical protein
MTTNLTMSAAAQAESDRKWARWIAAGAKRNRERQKRVTKFAIVIALAFAVWLTRILILG